LEEEENISKPCKDLILKILNVNKRMYDISEIINHEWLS
jgi:hypothetical protein